MEETHKEDTHKEETHKEDDVTQSRETRREAEAYSMSEPQSQPSSNDWEEEAPEVSESPSESPQQSNLDACNKYTERVCANASAEEKLLRSKPPAEV